MPYDALMHVMELDLFMLFSFSSYHFFLLFLSLFSFLLITFLFSSYHFSLLFLSLFSSLPITFLFSFSLFPLFLCFFRSFLSLFTPSYFSISSLPPFPFQIYAYLPIFCRFVFPSVFAVFRVFTLLCMCLFY